MTKNNTNTAGVAVAEDDDQLLLLFKKYGWVLGVIAVGAIGFVGYASYQSSAKKAAGQAQYEALETLNLDINDPNALAVLEGNGSALSALKRAEVKRAQGDEAGAQAIFREMSENKDHSDAMRDFAKLQLASLNEGEGAQELAAPGQPFIVEAKLLEADQLLGQGKTDEARIVLEALLANTSLQAERGLIESLVLGLGGELPEAADAPKPIESGDSAQNDEETETEGNADNQ